MAYVGDTGQGATLTLATTGAVGCVRTMQLPEWAMEKVDASCLETTGFMRYVPGDLTDPGEIVATVVFDASVAIPEGGVVGAVTGQFPIGDPAHTVNATLAGTGFISTRSLPNMATNELMEMTLTIPFDGDTGPDFTPEAAA